MIILSLETSCDDTCLALVKAKEKKQPMFEVISNFISSQASLHNRYGGVYPLLAKREHRKNLPLLFEKVKNKKPDLMAVTIGPGLDPCLWVGVNFAKKIAKEKGIPLVGVNHIESHLFSSYLDKPFKKTDFPAIALIISGGHTQLIFVNKIGDYKIIGETRDDAAGECFDKTARLLGLGYPGGPEIEKQASIAKKKEKKELPRPMIGQKNYDFSFSGLKTAVFYDYRKQSENKKKNKEYIRDMAREIQQSVIDVLIRKTIKAAKDFRVKTIILGGGVSANNELRKQFKKRIKKEMKGTLLLLPSKKYCTDNALMVAIAGYYNWILNKKRIWKKVKVNANLRIGK